MNNNYQKFLRKNSDSICYRIQINNNIFLQFNFFLNIQQ